MIKKLETRFAAMAAFLAASVASQAAFAVVEIEGPLGNDTIARAQGLMISGGRVEVTGILGNGPLGVNDVVDFYSFEGHAGDVVTVDIDGGMKSDLSVGSSVDTTIAIFRPDSTILQANDDGGIFDLGSVQPLGNLDSFIGNPGVRLQTKGIYTVGVSNSAHRFLDGGGLAPSGFPTNYTTGSYTLVISVVAAPVQQINIEIKPGTRDLAPPINPKSKGAIPVALLSNSDFDALGVDTTSITFGHSGNEHSLIRCFKESRDVDGDGRPDLLCHFDNEKTEFEPSDTAGMLKGRTAAGRQFEGQGYLKTVPVKRK